MTTTLKPTPDQLQARKKWVKSLRSGKYKQGVGTLYNLKDESYCCLGVACAINGNKFPHGANLAPYPEVRRKLGIDKNPKVRGVLTVAEYNDNGHSFEDIANRIEATLIKPFENVTEETA